MIKVTLDNNCLINLEKRTCQWEAVKEIIKLSKQGELIACVCAMSASEYQKTKRPIYKEFENFLERINCDDILQILPMGYYDITYFEHCLWSGEKEVNLEKEIHNILFPNIEYSYEKYCKKNGIQNVNGLKDKIWLNAKCDVQMIWSHINAENDFFVTEDSNFLKSKKNKLEIIGAKHIFKPIEFIEYYQRSVSFSV